MKFIAEGAEAKVYLDKNKIIKDRVKKAYRLPIIDENLRKLRTRSEAKLIREAERAGVNVPAVLETNDKTFKLEIEFLDGEKVRDVLDENWKLGEKIGEQIYKLHSRKIVHGDLTTSNMILKNNKIYLIDFGLGMITDRAEDMAVDLHLFKECLISRHNSVWQKVWRGFLKSYKNEKVLKHLKKVEARGRYKKLD
ncbi:MAG: Kae1-associated serine/threonine protein kinase [DPANN group archaeon]|nr:Kae1-associated serine/threonine protein kinase [DPANN group archaeon]